MIQKIKNFLIKKGCWPSRQQWGQIFGVFTKKEKILFFVFFALFLASTSFLFLNFYFKNTTTEPARGGVYIEGLIGQPRFINPIYANSDTDRDLTELIFSGLMKYDENMQIVPDLVKSYEIEEGGKVYTFHLKEKVLWQDKVPLTSDDVIFTIKTIQNPDYKSPLQENWIGIETERINDLNFKLKLKKPYAAFIENCTLKILPKHIWENVSPENFPLEVYNLKPIGSGMYQIKAVNQEKQNQIKSLSLVPNPLYFGKKPYISEIRFLFFDNQKDLIKEAKAGRINGFSPNQPEKLGNYWQDYYFSFPRYFAVFFNQEKSKVLSEKDVRIALNYATNKKQIIEKLNLSENSSAIVDSPILPNLYGFAAPKKVYEFNVDKAKEILEKAGFQDTNQDGIREKINKKELAFQFKSDLQSGSQGKEVGELQRCLAKFPEIYPEGDITNYFGPKTKDAVTRFQEKYAKEILEPWGFKNGTGMVSKATRDKLNQICLNAPEETIPLRFSLITVDQPQLVAVSTLLKEQWKAIGVELDIKSFPSSQLTQDFIKTRDYEALLFGEILGAIPDPFSFWHSSQKKHPGSNLSLYENTKADDLLEQARESLDPKIQADKLAQLQDLIIEDAPAIFLYSPDYIYSVSEKVKGINANKIAVPSERFIGIENWYIRTSRRWAPR